MEILGMKTSQVRRYLGQEFECLLNQNKGNYSSKESHFLHLGLEEGQDLPNLTTSCLLLLLLFQVLI